MNYTYNDLYKADYNWKHKINGIMCIGSLCEGFMFADFIEKRIYGPVDNWGCKSIEVIYKLFNNELYNAFINNEYIIEKNLGPTKHETPIIAHFFNDEFSIIHNNIEEQKYKNELLKRFDNFNKFNYLCQNDLDNRYLYFYSPNDADTNLDEQTVLSSINKLPKYVIDNLVIVQGARDNTAIIFKKYFRYIQFNMNFLSENSDILNLWNSVCWG